MAIITEETIPYDTFKTIILETLSELLGPEKEVSTNMVLKNNGIYLEGIMVKNTQSGISPTFYLETLYDMYKDGMPLDQVVDHILPFYEKEYNNEYFNTNIFGDFNEIKANLYIKLINSDRNQSLLKNCPNKPFLDLSQVIYLTVSDLSGSVGAVVVNNDLLKTWNKEFDSVYKIAVKNTYEKLGVTITCMSEFLLNLIDNNDESLMPSELIDDLRKTEADGDCTKYPMYIMTNNNRHLGASCLLFDEIKTFADSIDSDLYIIPSSIHEILLVPDDGGVSPEQLLTVLNMVNQTELSPAEYLSDNIYYYSCFTKKLTVL